MVTSSTASEPRSSRLPGAVDRLRAARETPDPTIHPESVPAPFVLAATDPAQPYGAALAWPETPGRPARTATSVVVLRAGTPLVWFDRRSHHLVTFPGTSATRAGPTRSSNSSRMAGPAASRSARSTVRQWATRSRRLLRAAGFIDGYRGLVARG